jgi:hypothetical protein
MSLAGSGIEGAGEAALRRPDGGQRGSSSIETRLRCGKVSTGANVRWAQ